MDHKISPQFLKGLIAFNARPDDGVLDIKSVKLEISKEDLALSHISRRANFICFVIDGAQFPSLAWQQFVRDSIYAATEKISQRDASQKRTQKTKFMLVYQTNGGG